MRQELLVRIPAPGGFAGWKHHGGLPQVCVDDFEARKVLLVVEGVVGSGDVEGVDEDLDLILRVFERESE